MEKICENCGQMYAEHCCCKCPKKVECYLKRAFTPDLQILLYG